MLDNMAEEGNMGESQDAHVEKSGLPKENLCCPWADSLTGQIGRLSRDLMTLRDQLHKLITHRKAVWCEKVRLWVAILIISNFSDPIFFSCLATAHPRAASLLLLCVSLAAISMSDLLQLLVCLCPQHARCSFKHKVGICPREAAC